MYIGFQLHLNHKIGMDWSGIELNPSSVKETSRLLTYIGSALLEQTCVYPHEINGGRDGGQREASKRKADSFFVFAEESKEGLFQACSC